MPLNESCEGILDISLKVLYDTICIKTAVVAASFCLEYFDFCHGVSY